MPLTKTQASIGRRIAAIAVGSAVVGYTLATATANAELPVWLFGLIGLGIVSYGLSNSLAARIGRDLREMRSRAESVFLRSDLTVPPADFAEIGVLDQALQHLQRQIDDQVNDANARRRELEIVLNSMTEGFLAINENETVFKFNPAASRMLDVDVKNAFGRSVRELVRDPDFHALVESILTNGVAAASELTLRHASGAQRQIAISGSAIRDDEDKIAGALFVLVDVTQLRHLETLRRDFVANVSHELKTPITSIKGYTETLLDGAIDEKDTARRFLEVIARQSERLQAIIEDLLALARIERYEEAQDVIKFKPTRINDLIDAAMLACAKLGETRRVSIKKSCATDLAAEIEPSLLEQAIVNLLNNAIKYSPEGGRVEIVAARDGDFIEIDVIDRGPGIARENQPRLFERFYRVDASRSREMGGTGLGLAIVKHIAQLHGGDARVESELGKGAKFTLRLPVGR